jgi:PadR family transcriptional regulator PadR
MWLGKFLNLEDDIEILRSKIKREIFKKIKKNKLTPLEFTTIEVIFNSNALSGYDIIQTLNKHFAGTWKAKSGTVYPMLSKLERNGFLKSKTVKSPIGPIRKVYTLTDAGEEILKVKVNKNFIDQLKFLENFIIELASIYVKSYDIKVRKKIIDEVQTTLNESFERIKNNIPSTLQFKTRCTKCGNEIGRKVAYCPFCGTQLGPEEESKVENSNVQE